MAEHVVKILESSFITLNVKRFLVEKPKGYSFIPGQATDVAVNLPEWKEKFRPFSFTGLNRWEHLEFMVKVYPERKGVTDLLGRTNSGELVIKEPYGAIQYKGPGVFIAGGSGITPFVSIFRELARNKQLMGNQLIYSNYTAADVICGAELHDMLKDNYVNHYTREGVIGFRERRLNRDFLIQYIADFNRRFYVCGSDGFVKDISEALISLGATSENLVIDK